MGARAYLLELASVAMPNPAQLSAAGTISTSAATITMAAALPAWVVAGMPVYDVTAGAYLGLVSSGAGSTTLTLAANAAHAGSGSADVLQFGFNPSDIQVGYTGGADLRGLVQIAQVKCTEAIALLQYIQNDLITSGQDSQANSILSSAITSLS